jgi:DNA-binding CsgD family transcriptional regulator
MVAAAREDAEGMKKHLLLALEVAGQQGKPAGRCEALARLAIESALLGWVQKDAGLLLEAEAWSSEAERLASSLHGDHPWASQAMAARALVLDRRGKTEEARRLARRALEGLVQMGIRYSDPPYPLYFDVVLAVARVLAPGEDEDAEWARNQVRGIVHLMGERTADEDVRVRWFRGPVQRELVELAGATHIPDPEPAFNMLTLDLHEGEADILALVATGMTNSEIATELGRSEESVARDLTAIYAKLGVSSRSGAMLYAFLGGVA